MAFTNFFGGAFFGGGFFGAGTDEGVPLGGKGDNDGRRRSTFKPTGLLHLPKKGRKNIEERIAETAEIHEEVEAKLAQEFVEPVVAIAPPAVRMSLTQIEREIGALLRKRIRTEEDEMLLLILVAACA